MKEYKYKINGNVYKVAIGDIEDNIAHVEVNGTPYKVEMEKAPKAVVKPVVRPVATTPAAPTTTVVKPAAPSSGKSGRMKSISRAARPRSMASPVWCSLHPGTATYCRVNASPRLCRVSSQMACCSA